MRRLQALLVGALLAGAPMVVPPIAAADGFASADCADADLVPSADNLPRVEGAVLCLINRERAGAGLVPLTRSIKLDRSARFHSVEMVTGHFLAHEAAGHPSLLARIRGFGFFAGARDGIYAENVGAGPASNGTARALMDAWMESPGHRTNLLYRPFRNVGISAVLAPRDPAFFADYPSTVYTTDFGTRYVRRRCTAPRPAPGTTPGSASPRRRYCRRR